MTDPKLNDILFLAENLDIGDAKKTRIKSFVRRANQFGKLNQVDLIKLTKMSRSEIVSERRKL